jgi:hypothetical protein
VSSESNWGLKGKYDEFGGKTRCTTRKGGVHDVELEVGKGRADVDGGAQNEIEGRKSRARSADED